MCFGFINFYCCCLMKVKESEIFFLMMKKHVVIVIHDHDLERGIEEDEKIIFFLWLFSLPRVRQGVVDSLKKSFNLPQPHRAPLPCVFFCFYVFFLLFSLFPFSFWSLIFLMPFSETFCTFGRSTAPFLIIFIHFSF